MLNKRGVDTGWIAFWVIIGLILTLIIWDIASTEFNVFSPKTANFDKAPIGFEMAFSINGPTSAFPALKVLNYIFGRIPGHLADQIAFGVGDKDGANISAGIITIAIWLIFFLIFADIMKLFGNFSPAVNWTVAGLLAVIGANLHIISIVTVYFLTILAIFGSFSILLSIGAIFGLFVLFHFGSKDMRRWILERRAEDYALRAAAGGAKAAGAIEGLGKISAALEELDKKHH